MKVVAIPYLQASIGDVIKQIFEDKHSFEVVPKHFFIHFFKIFFTVLISSFSWIQPDQVQSQTTSNCSWCA